MKKINKTRKPRPDKKLQKKLGGEEGVYKINFTSSKCFGLKAYTAYASSKLCKFVLFLALIVFLFSCNLSTTSEFRY